MNYSEYVLSHFQSISRKKWSLFIISRILHTLNDAEIKFVGQQLVRLGSGRRAVTDLYFPQFNIHLDIGEPSRKKQIADDERRDQEIVDATGHKIVRMPIMLGSVEKCIDAICQEVDAFVEHIRSSKQSLVSKGKFRPWEFGEEYQPRYHANRGYFDVSENPCLRAQGDVMRCFGFTRYAWMREAWPIPDGNGDIIWFPRLYPHDLWDNELADDGTTILERVRDGLDESEAQQARAIIEHQREQGQSGRHNIVFAKEKDALGLNILRYVGTFKMNSQYIDENCLKFDRVRSREELKPLATPD